MAPSLVRMKAGLRVQLGKRWLARARQVALPTANRMLGLVGRVLVVVRA